MTTEALRDLRDQLHAELSGDLPITPERRALLLDVKTEIDHLIARVPAVETLSPTESQQLRERLQSVTVSFEGSHPQLASTLERALLVLSNMGL